MSQPLSPSTSPATNGHALPGNAAPYHPTLANFSAFPGLHSLAQSLSTQSHVSLSPPTQQLLAQSQSQPASSSGSSDIEKLERLKREILEGQNPIYKAVPQPGFLENLYLGRSVLTENSTPAHPDQVAKDSSQSGSAQAARSTSSTDDAKTEDSDREPAGNHAQGGSEEDTKSAHTVSSDAREGVIGEVGSGHAEEDYPVRPISAPQVEVKSPQAEQQCFRTSSVTGQDSLQSSSVEDADAANLVHLLRSQPTIFPSSQDLSILATTENPGSSHSPLSEPVLSKDPPYDPKESLRHLNNRNVWSNEPYRLAADPQYGRLSDDRPDRGPQKGGDWDSTHGNRFDERGYEPDGYRDRHLITVSSGDLEDPAYRNYQGYDDLYSQENHASQDARRVLSRISTDAFKAADKLSAHELQSDGQSVHLNISGTTPGAANDTSQKYFGHSETNVSSITPSSAAGDALMAHTRSFSHALGDQSRFDDHSDLQPAAEGTSRSSFNDASGSQTAEASKGAAFEERAADPASSASTNGKGIHIPLEERASPFILPPQPVSAPRADARDWSYLGDRSGPKPTNASVNTSSGQEPFYIADARSIPTPLSLVRPRLADGKVVPSSPASTSATGQAFAQKGQGQPIRALSSNADQPYDLLQPRFSPPRNDTQTPVRGTPLDTYSPLRTPSDESPDSKLIPSAAYLDDRRRVDGGRPYTDVPHYERPIFRERDAFGERTGLAGETGPWRGRGAYTKPYGPRRGGHPPSGNSPRVWGANARNGRQPGSNLAENREKYFNRESDRHPPPRSWDREEAGYPRPPPEIYPPPEDLERERYPPAEFHERHPVRGRSPSPNPLRRATYGGPVSDYRPLKRVRDEAYYDDRGRRYPEYQVHQAPPNAYYDARTPTVPRDVHNGYHDHDAPYYDRRVSDMGPPPSPQYPGRSIYSRPDVERYAGPPPRTA